MADEKRSQPLRSPDADWGTGAVEDGGRDMINKQILPVWASTEPFGYEGDAADQQVVGGGGGGGGTPGGKLHARRDVIGPGA